MLEWLLLLIVLALIGGGTALALRRAQFRRVARERLQDAALPTPEAETFEPIRTRVSRVMRRWRWLPTLLAPCLAAVLYWGIGWPVSYAAAVAVLSWLSALLLEGVLSQRRKLRTEQQLADSIDMLVAGVKSGASLQGALDSALENSPRPWRDELEEIVGRIRYGDEPTEVFNELAERLPLETVRLFADTLALNWSVGGQLASTLANVGRTIRDRVELARRVQAMSMQARVSVMIIMVVTYFLATLMWRNNPDRMLGFLRSSIGQALCSIGMVLQGIGMVWIAWLARVKF